MLKFQIDGLQHCLTPGAECIAHSTRMNEEFTVQCQFNGDEMTYIGSYENVLKAVVDHYHGDVEEAFACHPELEIK